MLLPSLAILAGLILLVWSAEHFVEGASAVAQHLGMPPLLVGMLIVGFGTSAPELTVAILSASQGNPGLSLGNAWGANILNMALILGVTALIMPLAVQSSILRKELPVLMAVAALTILLVYDGRLSRPDAGVLLLVFATLVTWTITQAQNRHRDTLAVETAAELRSDAHTLPHAIGKLIGGALVLVGGSRLMVWGAVSIAQTLGVSDVVIGLTLVAIGTSLPELASCVTAARKGQDDIALGNVLGSVFFNSLAVVGVAGVIAPMDIDAALLTRDLPVMAGLTVLLFALGWGFRGPGRINRAEGALLVAVYIGYTAWLLRSMAQSA
ncbi:MAG: calcium/sodium antiporter [Burkholderiales bacterium RIFCSPLOWO2_12_67_14]|nr:MAG: calcium/sodium antiporter [Burkholderiales bacterium RIFCSPLOWO2_02_FULL_67_64]OGB37858.1 MAG: calcium/sodium antiporter [Burkholderiales bacterium RIFCSPHIGHO2_12_FULL_67_38]OGB44288.1 MAG: calcium/sodium antiporter [Burkholderiales bacterium RIFCSPLOWO2_12_67_14]OGB99387.1 MAG: calcium/sodium antiporter [Burkholderiales bacterium RIFCSPLOWO2_12_FULL_67_210]